MSNIAIKVENLSKAYQLGEIGTGTISRDLERWYARMRGKEDPFLKIGETNDRSSKGTSDIVWSLKDINFEIEQGDAVGIIGRNGAGKSTLLKILSRVTSPTTGKITGKGRIASLLEVGTGFHPELTGRENIYLNGAILGMRKKEIARKFDEIVDFAGVQRYIDTPVKRYSSGMYVRLAFAVAAHLESEILIVDEVLAVGDAEFQKKCLGKMGDVSKGEGRTVLFVSHNMNSIAQFCNTGILLENGFAKNMGQINGIIKEYLSLNSSTSSIWIKSSESYAHVNFDLQEFSLVNDQKMPLLNTVVENDLEIGVKINFSVKDIHPSLCYGIAVFNQNQDCLFWSYNTDTASENWPEVNSGMNEVVIWLPKRTLNEGSYAIKIISSLHFIQWIISPEDGPFVNLEIKGGLSDSPIWNDARPGLLAPVLNFEKNN